MSVHKHHRKRRSQGGDDSLVNILELDFETHEAVHRNPELAYEHGLLVKSWQEPGDVTVDIAGFLAALGRTPVGTGAQDGEEHQHGVEKPCPKCHGKGKIVEQPKDPDQPQAPERKKVTWSVRVPKDEREDGYEVLDSLVDGAVDLLADAKLLRDRNKGANYYSLVYVLAFFQQNFTPGEA